MCAAPLSLSSVCISVSSPDILRDHPSLWLLVNRSRIEKTKTIDLHLEVVLSINPQRQTNVHARKILLEVTEDCALSLPSHQLRKNHLHDVSIRPIHIHLAEALHVLQTARILQKTPLHVRTFFISVLIVSLMSSPCSASASDHDIPRTIQPILILDPSRSRMNELKSWSFDCLS